MRGLESFLIYYKIDGNGLWQVTKLGWVGQRSVGSEEDFYGENHLRYTI